MKIIRHNINIKKRTGVITIDFIGDIHEGNVNSNTEALKKAVNRIKKQGNYWVGMGDYIDAINTQDPRFDAKEISERYNISDLNNLPVVQANRIIKILTPIKDKCIGFLSGNHEDMYAKKHSFDVYTYIADSLGVPKLGYVGDVVLYIKTNNKNVGRLHIALNHGSGSASAISEGAIYYKLDKLFKYRFADVCVAGHYHRLASFEKSLLTVNQKGNDYKYIRQVYGCSGCFLETYVNNNKNYYEHKGGKPSKIGMLELKFNFDDEYNKNLIMYPVVF